MYFSGRTSKCEIWKFKSKVNSPVSNPDSWKLIYYWDHEKMHGHVSV